MYRSFLAFAASALLASAASATISFTYTSTSGNPLDSFSFSLADDFTPAKSDVDTFTTGPVATSSNTAFGPTKYFDDYRFHAEGGFNSVFYSYSGPIVFSGSTAAPLFINGSYTFKNDDNLGTLTIAGGASAPSPAPEPESWALMVTGFGAIGGALRNRRKIAVRFA